MFFYHLLSLHQVRGHFHCKLSICSWQFSHLSRYAFIKLYTNSWRKWATWLWKKHLGHFETQVAGEAEVLNIFALKGRSKSQGPDVKIAGCRVSLMDVSPSLQPWGCWGVGRLVFRVYAHHWKGRSRMCKLLERAAIVDLSFRIAMISRLETPSTAWGKWK